MARIVQLKLTDEIKPVFKIVHDSWKVPSLKVKSSSYIWYVNDNLNFNPEKLIKGFKTERIISKKYNGAGFYRVYVRRTFGTIDIF